MARRIAVNLDLQADQYIRGAAEVAATTKAVDKELHALDRQVEETGRDMDKLAVQAAVAKHEIGALGTEAVKSAVEVKGLDERIMATRLHVGQMAAQFGRTGNLVDQQNLRDSKRLLATLERTRRDILLFATSDVIEQAGVLASNEIAAGVSAGVKGGIASGFGAAEFLPAILAVTAGPLTLFVSYLGALVAGAVAGTAGLGGIAGGVIAAAKDPRVKAAFTNFKAEIFDAVFGGTFNNQMAFVQPILNSLQIITQGFRDMHLADVFAKGAPALTTLAHGIVDLVQNALPGFNEIMDRSGPIMKVIADGLGEIGRAFGDFLHEVAQSPGTLVGLEELFLLLSNTIRGLGHMLGALGNVFVGFLIQMDVFAQTFDWLPGVGDQLHNFHLKLEELIAAGGNFAQSMDDVTNSAAGLSAQTNVLSRASDDAAAAIKAEDQYLKDLVTALDAATQGSLDLWQANIDVKSAMANVSQALKENGKNWNLNTAAGRANQQAVKDAITAIERQRDAQIALSDGTPAAIAKIEKAYNDQIVVLEKVAEKLGYVKSKALDLTKTPYTVKIGVPPPYGIGSAERALDQLAQHARNVPSLIHIAAHVSWIAAKAEGGFIPPFMPVKVGEKGTEIVTPLVPSYVVPHNQVAAWHGGGTPTASGAMNYYKIDVHVAPGADLREVGRQTVAAIQYYEQANGRRWRTP